MRILLLILSIFMLFATTAIIFLGFALLEPSGVNLFIISMMSLMGYLGSYLYFASYRDYHKPVKEKP